VLSLVSDQTLIMQVGEQRPADKGNHQTAASGEPERLGGGVGNSGSSNTFNTANKKF
jgi:hypothetical protein